MKVELGFLDDFKCTYSKVLPICNEEQDTEIGTCTMRVENEKYVGDLRFNNEGKVNKDFFLWCKWHIAEDELLTVDKLCLTKEVIDAGFSVQLKQAITA